MAPWERVVYDIGHMGRVAWYLGHALGAQRLASPVLDGIPEGLPDRNAYLADLRGLLERDRAHIAAGRYRMPEDVLPRPASAWRRSQRFLADVGRINLRRQRRDGQEVFRARRTEQAGKPRYYLQNFHYQTDGWLSDESAELYDFQVEVLFNGAADAMRRQALLPLAGHLRGKRQETLRFLDIGCGTGRFLRSVKRNFPRLPVTGLDLSRPYINKAARALEAWSWVSFIEGPAEQLPCREASHDIVTSVYLLHELPKKIRRLAIAEMARVLKPGGRLILVDSLQHGDHRHFDGLLDLFPVLYHEPYYADYVKADLLDLLAQNGLKLLGIDRAFLSKIITAAKPA